MSSAVNADGVNILTKVEDQIRLNRSKKKRLTSKFWAQIIEEYDLDSGRLDALDDPDEDEPFRNIIEQKIGMAHHDNPAARDTEPFELLCEKIDDFNYVEYYGMFHGAMESQMIVRDASNRMLVAIAKNIQRTAARQSNGMGELSHGASPAMGCQKNVSKHTHVLA